MNYKRIQDVPWYRRNKINGWFLILCYVFIFFPFSLVTFIIFITGDIYFPDTDKNGYLLTWQWYHKLLASLVIIIQLFFYYFLLSYINFDLSKL
jgi:hypothetical protein